MNFDRLRALVIEESVRGNLVPQISSEGTVEQIGKMPEGVPFDIPKTWKWVCLKSVVTKHVGGGTPSKAIPSYWNGDIPWASVKDMKGFVLSSTKDSITEEGLENSSSNLVDEGTVILCTRMSLGKVAISAMPVAINQDLRALFFREEVDKKFFMYVYRSMKIEGSGTTVKGIQISQLMNQPFPLPPLAEQARIVAKIEENFSEIARAEKAYQELQNLSEVLRGKILQKAIEGKLVPQLESEEPVEQIGSVPEDVPFAIPEKWKWCVLDEIGEFKKGPFGSALTKSMFIPDGPNAVRVYEQRNAIEKDSTFARYFISREYYESKMKSFTVLSGDLIVSCAGTIGEIYILPEDAKEGIINQALMRVRLTNVVTREYFKLVFSSLIKDLCIAESGGTAIKNIPPFKIFKQFPIPVPPIQEQNRIVQKVYDLIEQVDSLVGKKIMS